MAVPSLASIASTSLTSHVHGLDAAIARCVDQSKELTARKDALLVELGVVSESLEQLHIDRATTEITDEACTALAAAQAVDLRDAPYRRKPRALTVLI